MYKKLKLVESEKKDLKESNFDKAQAILPLDNYHSMGIIVSDNGETVQYMYSNEDTVYESEIEFDEEGNPYFKDEQGEKWMISDFMRTNLGESVLSGKANLTEADDDIEELQDKAEEDLENQEELEDTLDSEENQEENPVEEESELDNQLNELRDILVDLDLNLYQITDKEDLNNSIYVIGKVADESNDILMLIDTQPEEVNSEEIPEEEPIINDIDIDNKDLKEAVIPNHNNLTCPKCKSNNYVEIDDGEYEDGTQEYHYECKDCGYISNKDGYDLEEADERTYKDEDEAEYYRNKELYANSNLARHKEAMEKAAKACKEKGIKLDEAEEIETPEEEEDNKTELEQRFDFVKLPSTFEEVNKLNPRYGEELTPDHDAIVEYLMNCLIEINPEAAEELQKEEPNETPIEPEEDIDLDISIDGEEDLEDEDKY